MIDDAGEYLYSASSDTYIKKWDCVTGACLMTLEGHLTSVYMLLYSDGCLWSTSADKTARRWDVEKGVADITLLHDDFCKSIQVCCDIDSRLLDRLLLLALETR